MAPWDGGCTSRQRTRVRHRCLSRRKRRRTRRCLLLHPWTAGAPGGMDLLIRMRNLGLCRMRRIEWQGSFLDFGVNWVLFLVYVLIYNFGYKQVYRLDENVTSHVSRCMALNIDCIISCSIQVHVDVLETGYRCSKFYPERVDRSESTELGVYCLLVFSCLRLSQLYLHLYLSPTLPCNSIWAFCAMAI